MGLRRKGWTVDGLDPIRLYPYPRATTPTLPLVTSPESPNLSLMLTLEYLAELLQKHPEAAKTTTRSFRLGAHSFGGDSGPRLMGVVNLSPDSWYRESVALGTEAAIERGRILEAQGAHIIDVGAESTLAHAARVNAEAQCSRLLPVVRGLCERGIIVSVETYQPEVTRACLEAGAKVINLTSGAPDDDLFRMVAAHDAAVILCHVQGANVREVGDFDLRADPVAFMREGFERQIGQATRLGVSRIFVDPGLGFYYRNLQDSSLRVRHQMSVFLNTFRLRDLGWPVCHALPHAVEHFKEEVRCAEPFFAVLAALGRTDLFRTHEVARVRPVLETLRTF